MLEGTHKARASSAARAIAWLEIELRDANIAIWIALFGAVIIVLLMLIATGGKVGEDSEKKEAPAKSVLQSQGMTGGLGAARGPALSITPAGSRMPTQQSLSQQRTPLASSTALAGGATAQGGGREVAKKPDEAFELPPICPSLILPHTEARFMIQMDHLLRQTTGPVNILGTSGRKLLHALVCDSPDGRRCLMLASCGCEDDPRTCIFTPTDTSQALEVFGKAGKFYGWLELPGRNQGVLLYSGDAGEQKPVLQIEMGNPQDLRMSASTMDGRLLASAGRNVGVGSQQFSSQGSDSWKMQVKPGVDAVLITSCMLALILLRPSDDRLSMGGASTVGGTAASLRPLPSALPPSWR
jgi:hypothetical protein